MVERKGSAYDTICDALAEKPEPRAVARLLERCGAILHHTSPGLLVRRRASRLRRREVTEPIEIPARRARHGAVRRERRFRWRKLPSRKPPLAARAPAQSRRRPPGAHPAAHPAHSPTWRRCSCAISKAARPRHDTSLGVGYARSCAGARGARCRERTSTRRATKRIHPLSARHQGDGPRSEAGIALKVACALGRPHVDALAIISTNKSCLPSGVARPVRRQTVR